MHYLFMLELVIAGVIILMLVAIGIIYFNVKNKKVARNLEKAMDFLKFILGYV